MSRPLLLLPPSKGKSAGGEGPGYGATLPSGHPLTPARRAVLDAVVRAAREVDDASVARWCGVGAARVADARADLLALEDAPTLPAHRRYTGVVHGNAGLADLDPGEVGVDVRIVSPLLGLAALGEPVPPYRLELAARLPQLGGLGPFWREHLREPLRRLGSGTRVWDLLPAEHARVWDAAVRDELDLVQVRFVRPDGRAANAARTKVCKGRLTAALLAAPDLEPQQLVREVEPGPGWTLRVEGTGVTAEFAG